MSTITSANSVFTISWATSVARVFAVPQQLQGFAADDIFSSDILGTAEVLMGVDGALSGGYVFNPIVQHISLQADSLSNTVFDIWYAYQQQLREVIFVQGQVILPTLTYPMISRNLKYIDQQYPMRVIFEMYNGILTNYPIMADAGRTLRPRRYTITWERIGAKPADSSVITTQEAASSINVAGGTTIPGAFP